MKKVCIQTINRHHYHEGVVWMRHHYHAGVIPFSIIQTIKLCSHLKDLFVFSLRDLWTQHLCKLFILSLYSTCQQNYSVIMIFCLFFSVCVVILILFVIVVFSVGCLFILGVGGGSGRRGHGSAKTHRLLSIMLRFQMFSMKWV